MTKILQVTNLTALTIVPRVQLQKIVDVIDASRAEHNAVILFGNCVACALGVARLLDAEPVARCDFANVLFDRLRVVHGGGPWWKMVGRGEAPALLDCSAGDA